MAREGQEGQVGWCVLGYTYSHADDRPLVRRSLGRMPRDEDSFDWCSQCIESRDGSIIISLCKRSGEGNEESNEAWVTKGKIVRTKGK
jgi:hypothetical protein